MRSSKINCSNTYSPEAFSQAGGFRHPDSVIYEPLVLLDLSKFRIEQGVRIDPFCHLAGGNGVKLGPRTHLAVGVTVVGGGYFETGWCVGLSPGVRITTGTDEPLQGLAGACIPEEYRTVRRGEVIIEDFTILFTNVVVMPGVRIGKGVVVAAGCLINRSLEPWTIYAGTPLRKIGIRDRIKVEETAEQMRNRYGF